MVFFVLSGFLVGGTVVSRYEAIQWSWSDYAIARTTRLCIASPGPPIRRFGTILGWRSPTRPSIPAEWGGYTLARPTFTTSHLSSAIRVERPVAANRSIPPALKPARAHRSVYPGPKGLDALRQARNELPCLHPIFHQSKRQSWKSGLTLKATGLTARHLADGRPPDGPRHSSQHAKPSKKPCRCRGARQQEIEPV